jgi:hypothetical protein
MFEAFKASALGTISRTNGPAGQAMSVGEETVD